MIVLVKLSDAGGVDIMKLIKQSSCMRAHRGMSYIAILVMDERIAGNVTWSFWKFDVTNTVLCDAKTRE